MCDTKKPTIFDAKEVHSTFDEDDTNLLLKTGWTLCCALISHENNSSYQAKPCYVLIKIPKDPVKSL